MANTFPWMVTSIKCLGKIKNSRTSHNLEAAIGKWLFVFSETKFDEEGEHTVGTSALVPSELVKDGSFIGADIREFEIADSYGIHILANCRLELTLVY